ncbi:MAG: hypothetical protein VW338_09715 [Rhodospirillaceae bacterium]
MEKAPLESLKVSDTEAGSKSNELAHVLHTKGTVDPSLQIHALKDGEARLFVDLMAKATGVRQELIMRFVLEPSSESLPAIQPHARHGRQPVQADLHALP